MNGSLSVYFLFEFENKYDKLEFNTILNNIILHIENLNLIAVLNSSLSNFTQIQINAGHIFTPIRSLY